jgi:thiol-disulfide isomerase/thioredoxin
VEGTGVPAATAIGAGRRYRFERLSFRAVLEDMRFGADAPGPGDRVPEFDLATVGSGRVRSRDPNATGPMLLIFGSSTCPVTDSAAPGLTQLHRRFGERVRFVMVNVREAHPGASIPQPSTLGTKLAHAEHLRRLHGFGFEVAVDDIDGALHRAMSPKPNSAYLIAVDGTILFRAHWASDTNGLAAALEAVTAGGVPHHGTSGGVLKAILRMLPHLPPVLDRAGRGAWADMWRVAPPLAAFALLLKILGISAGGPRRARSVDYVWNERSTAPEAAPTGNRTAKTQ